jgi:ribonuclease Z
MQLENADCSRKKIRVAASSLGEGSMPRHFDPTLVNGPFDDPGLYVDLVFERRALLFDIGDVTGLPSRKLLRISDVFVTHRHMDHFAGFDHLLRRLLGREKNLGVYGSAGFIDAVEHKLKAYTWNLIEGHDGELVIRATEVDSSNDVRKAVFRGRSRFERSETETGRRRDDILLEQRAFDRTPLPVFKRSHDRQSKI